MFVFPPIGVVDNPGPFAASQDSSESKFPSSAALEGRRYLFTRWVNSRAFSRNRLKMGVFLKDPHVSWKTKKNTVVVKSRTKSKWFLKKTNSMWTTWCEFKLYGLLHVNHIFKSIVNICEYLKLRGDFPHDRLTWSVIQVKHVIQKLHQNGTVR